MLSICAMKKLSSTRHANIAELVGLLKLHDFDDAAVSSQAHASNSCIGLLRFPVDDWVSLEGQLSENNVEFNHKTKTMAGQNFNYRSSRKGAAGILSKR